jgi:hypothetical protein
MAKATGYGIVAGAILMAVPIPLLPLTNTFPALALVFFGLAQLKLSYAKLLIACGFLVLSVLLFVALGIGIAVLGLEGVRALFGL